MARLKSRTVKKVAVKKSIVNSRSVKKSKARSTPVVSAKKSKVTARKTPARIRSPLPKKLIPQKAVRFKKVRHPHDGQGIQFRVPTSWKETWGSEDNALFYLPLPGVEGPSPITGRLFVRFRLEPVGNANDGATFGLLMSHRTDKSQTVTEIEPGTFMLHFSTRHNTEGYHAVDYFWFLARAFPPRRIGLACFLFSGVAELFDGKQAPEAHIVAMLEKEIPKAVFDQERLPVDIDDHP